MVFIIRDNLTLLDVSIGGVSRDSFVGTIIPRLHEQHFPLLQLAEKSAAIAASPAGLDELIKSSKSFCGG